MKRKIYDQLLLWKNKRKGKSAMMIEGARRVGKSYIVREFAQTGMLMENIVGQMLTAIGCKLFFYSNSSRENKDDRMEIDFLISKKDITSRHNISPIEVKSSTRFTTISLEKCVKKYSTHLAQAYIVHTGDIEKHGDFLYIPLYMVPCL